MKNSENPELTLVRIFDAPREIVFKAWTDQKELAQWWGPHGFTNPICKIDVRKGGKIKIDMKSPDGTVYPMTGVYEEISEPERLVYTSFAFDENGKLLFEVLNTITFEDNKGKTKLTYHARVSKAITGAEPYLKGMNVGWTQSLERLAQSVETKDREILITRIVNASRELVWNAWTDPKQIVQWWGPNGFTTTTKKISIKKGGVWQLVMHGPDGKDYPGEVVFTQIIEPKLIEYEHMGEENANDAQFRSSIMFSEEGSKTKVTVRLVFKTAKELKENIEKYGSLEGAKQMLERFDEHMVRQTDLVISHTVNAPKKVVWDLLTQSQHLKHWWGPNGFTMGTCDVFLRPGGYFHYSMKTPDGKEMWGKFIYREITPPDRIVFVNVFSNEKGEITRNPFSPIWPKEVLSTLTLSEEKGKTTITLTGRPINATDEECNAFQAGRESMGKGFAGTWKQLENYAATIGKNSSTGFSLKIVSDVEVLVTYVLNAPRELVFEAYTDPKAIPKWWGPGGLTTKVDKMDLKVGGVWRFIQHDQSGNEYAFNGVYKEIDAPKLIVDTFEFEGAPGHIMTERISFEEQEGRTKVTVKVLFKNKQDRDGMVNNGMEDGMRESIERLNEYADRKK